MNERNSMRNESCTRINRVGGASSEGYLIDALVPSMLDLMTGDEAKQLMKAILRDLDGIPYDTVTLDGNAAAVARILAELANVPGLKD